MSDATLLETGGQGNTGAAGEQQTAATTQQQTAPAAATAQGGEQPQTQTDGQQPAGQETPATNGETPAGEEGKEGKTAGNDLHGVPEANAEYTDFVAPEGVTYSPESVAGVKGLAKELDLSQTGAQKLMERAHDFMQTVAVAQQDVVKQARAEWQQQTRTDKDFGGANLDANLATAAKAVTAFLDDDAKQVLNVSGLGDHPALVRAFIKIGKAMSEDSMVVGTPGRTADTRSTAKRLYPNQN